MASVTTNKSTSLLILIGILQGTLSQTTFIELDTVVKVAVGQDISLPCVLSNRNSKVIQIQWLKEGKQGDQKLVLFNPAFSPIYYVNVTLELVNDTNTAELRGSILHLQEATEQDSGDYICEITSFPDGSIKNFTKVQVTVPKVSVEVTPTNMTVIEGDTVSITCVCDPPPDKYMLSSSLSRSVIESQYGKFIIQNVTRDMSDLTCRPLWSSSNQRLQHLSASVHLTVDFLDNIECSSESQIQVETGTNLTITCEAKSSQPMHFVWNKDNMTVSSNFSINLWSVTPDESGIYTLIVHTGNNRLHREKIFTVTVTITRPTEHLTSTVPMETTPQISSTAITTPELNVTTETLQTEHHSSTTDRTSTEEVTYISTSTPPTGNVTDVHVNLTTTDTGVKSSATTFTHTSGEDRTLSEICCTSSPESASRTINYTLSTLDSISKDTMRNTVLGTKITNKKEVSPSKSVFVIIPFLLLLTVIGFLYRQYLIQKRLDMPPPFKPPPPPVKYTSARNNHIPVTDILV